MTQEFVSRSEAARPGMHHSVAPLWLLLTPSLPFARSDGKRTHVFGDLFNVINGIEVASYGLA